MEVEKVTLQLGMLTHEVTICTNDELDAHTVGIPKRLFAELTLPEDLEFEWELKDKRFVLGPFIGMIRYYNFEKIKLRNLNFLLRWLNDYKNIKGLIYVIPICEIDIKNRFVNGYYYNPNKRKKEQWTYGTFPFPCAAFHRPFLRLGKKYKILTDIIGDTCFNKNEPGKWEFYSWMTENPLTKGFVPYTENLEQMKQIYLLLEKYPMLYLKRRYGGLGNGIYQVRKTDQGFEVIDNKQQKHSFINRVKMEEHLGNILKKHKYIVQQGVPFQFDGKNIDFRAYLQKDGTMEWKFRGCIARVASSGNITTNIRFTEKLIAGKEALMHLYGYQENTASEKIKKIEEACILCGRSIDQFGGHYGDIALDFIFDHNDNIYFLEANSGYGHKSLALLREPQLRQEIMNSPINYAKALAGFPSTSNKAYLSR